MIRVRLSPGTGRGVRCLLAALTVGPVLLASACGGSGSSSASATSAPSAPLHSLLPSSVASAGVVNVATLDGNAPWEYFKGSTLEGIDADILNDMAPLLGVKLTFANVPFPSEIPGLLAGRYNIIMMSLGDTAAREQTMNFLDYGEDSSKIVVLKGNPQNINTTQDMCGKRITILAGSSEITQVQDISKTCATPIQITTTSSVEDMDLAVVSGRADMALDPYSSEAYAMKQATSGYLTQLQISSVPPIYPAYNGIAFQKSDGQLLVAFTAALQMLVDNGSYASIMSKWGCSGLAVNGAVVDGGPTAFGS